MFEMYLYTSAEPYYTAKMMELLDPEKKYFDSQVISRTNFNHGSRKKDLALVLVQDRATVILDDTRLAWPWHQDNRESYDYFPPRKERLSEMYFPPCFFPSAFHQYREDNYSERKMDEKGSKKVMLQSVLEVLQEIHGQFLIQVLKECKIFLGLGDLEVYNGNLRSLAQGLGAVCCAELDSSVTHVVTCLKNVPSKRHEHNCFSGSARMDSGFLQVTAEATRS